MKLMPHVRSRQRGAVIVLVGIAIAVLVGFVGIVIDLGRLFVIKTEMQNALDGCALAAARGLNGLPANTAALLPAENAGLTVGNIHQLDFHGENLALTSTDITFSTTLNGTYQTRNDVAPATVPDLKYARCTFSRNGLSTYFIRVLGPDTASVSALATATLAPSQTACAIPLGVCAPNAASPPDFGFISGTWYGGKFGTGGSGPATFSCAAPSNVSGGFSGSYNWIDFTPPGGGANELKDLLGGTGQCNLPPVGTPVGEQGQIAGLTDAWNSRFGVYKNGGQINQTNAKPDFTGNGYTCDNWAQQAGQPPERRNAYTGSSAATGEVNYLSNKTARTPYQTSNPAGISNAYPLPTGTNHAGLGTDKRVAIAPIVDCNLLSGSNPQQVPVLSYACVLMLSPIDGPEDVVIEYLNLASATSNNPCASSGLGGGISGPLVPVLVQ
jgi:Flp pilus assembly protein TadG